MHERVQSSELRALDAFTEERECQSMVSTNMATRRLNNELVTSHRRRPQTRRPHAMECVLTRVEMFDFLSSGLLAFIVIRQSRLVSESIQGYQPVAALERIRATLDQCGTET